MKLPILGVTFQENCRYSVHVRSKLIKANRCVFILRSLRKEGLQQDELDHLFNSIVLPDFTNGLSYIDALKGNIYLYIRELLEKADRKLHKSRSTNPLCPINKIFPKQKQTKYRLRNSSAIRPKVITCNRQIQKCIYKQVHF